jgi:hypothetical protein
MDILTLRDHARRLQLADRVERRDLEWERGPVAIVVRAEPRPPSWVRVLVRDCGTCGERHCRC